MIYRKHSLVIITLVLALLLGCVRWSVSPVSMEPTVDFAFSQTRTPVQTATPAVPTATPVLTLAATADSGAANLTIRCLEIQDSLPAEAIHDGYLILDMNLTPYLGHFYNAVLTIDMQTHLTNLLTMPNEKDWYIISSPDRHWIAYQQRISATSQTGIKNLVISDALAINRVILPWEENWSRLVSWVDDDQLVIRLSNTNNRTNGKPKFLLLNPFTGERVNLDSEFPFMLPLNIIPTDWDGWGITVFNNLLDRVIYMRSEDGFSSYEYVLWDVQNETTLASINVLGDIEQIPYWSKEKNQFVLAFSPYDPQGESRYWPIFELHTIDKNGEVVQRTRLSAIYDWVSISDYSWSPDGNEIAF